MQLRSARLCLDCEELHQENHCPICASEAFAFLTQWVPVDDRRRARRAQLRQAAQPQTDNGLWWLKRGAAGLALIAAGRLMWRTTQAADEAAAARPPERE